MKFTWLTGLALSGAIGFAGCAGTMAADEPPPLDGSAWVLASLPGRSLVPDTTPTAQFEAGRVAGSDGCNRYAMPFTVEGSAIRIGPVGPSTRMACPEITTAQAEAFTAALITARRFRLGDGTLELLDETGGVLVTLATQVQSLADTSWRVVNINNGRQAVVGMVSDSTVTMEFDDEGRVSGDTGCNRYTASYRTAGDALEFSSVATTRRACPDPSLADQEQAFLRALASVATLSFEGDRLDLRQTNGELGIILARKP